MLEKPDAHPWEVWTPEDHLYVNKAKYLSLGGIRSLISLLAATVLRRNQTVNVWPCGEMALGGAYKSGTQNVILAWKW